MANYLKSILSALTNSRKNESKRSIEQDIADLKKEHVTDKMSIAGIIHKIEINAFNRNFYYVSERPEIFDTSKYNLWGANVVVTDHNSAHGWLSPLPNAGSLILTNMASGKRAFYVVTSVRPCRNPSDMFFADILPLGYLIATESNISLLNSIEYKNAVG